MRTRRRLIALCVVLAALLVCAGIKYWPTPRRAALARIEALNGTYLEQLDLESGPYQVTVVVLTLRPVTEEDLAALKDLRPLHRLLLDGSPVTDAGLAHIGQLEELELLNLTDSKITDERLVHLRGLRNLKMLALGRTHVTDAGLIHLRGLTQLRSLNLSGTGVSDQGAEELRRALPNLVLLDFNLSDEDDQRKAASDKRVDLKTGARATP